MGLYEGMDESYLTYRLGSIAYLGGRLDELGIPYQKPAGGHGIFLDAQKFYPQIPWYEFPGQVLSVELYKECGIRTCDIGSYMMDPDPDTGEAVRSINEFTRLAIPRRVYTQSHFDLAVEPSTTSGSGARNCSTVTASCGVQTCCATSRPRWPPLMHDPPQLPPKIRWERMRCFHGRSKQDQCPKPGTVG